VDAARLESGLSTRDVDRAGPQAAQGRPERGVVGQVLQEHGEAARSERPGEVADVDLVEPLEVRFDGGAVIGDEAGGADYSPGFDPSQAPTIAFMSPVVRRSKGNGTGCPSSPVVGSMREAKFRA
jgi:hypothetical protein